MKQSLQQLPLDLLQLILQVEDCSKVLVKVLRIVDYLQYLLQIIGGSGSRSFYFGLQSVVEAQSFRIDSQQTTRVFNLELLFFQLVLEVGSFTVRLDEHVGLSLQVLDLL